MPRKSCRHFISTFASPSDFAPTLDGLTLTTITGNFSQNNSGIIIADIAFDRNDKGVPGTDEMDRIFVTGSAALDGRLQLSPITGAASAGTFVLPFLYAENGLTDNGLTIHNEYVNGTSSSTATFTPTLVWDSNLLSLSYTIDFCPGTLTQNQESYCDAVTRIQAYGWPAFEIVAQNILRVVDHEDLQTVYDSLDGEGVVAAAEAQYGLARQMGSVMGGAADSGLDCLYAADSTQEEDCHEGTKFWLDGSGRMKSAEGDGNTSDHDHTNGNLTVGNLTNFDDAFVNLAMGSSWSAFSNEGRWTSGESTGLWIGAGGGVELGGGGYLIANAGAGMSQTGYNRIAFGYSLDGELDPHHISGDFLSFQGSAATELGWHANPGGPVDFQLFGGLESVMQSRSDFRETDPIWGNHYLSSSYTDHFARVGSVLALRHEMPNGVILKPSLGVTRTEGIAVEDRSITVRSRGADAKGFEWLVMGAKPDYEGYEYAAEMNIETSGGVDFKFSATAWEAQNDNYDVNASVNVLWKL
jgi:hypothetical protein